MNLLFICSRNQWRSPTAERIWRRDNTVAVRSAGTSRNARKHVTFADIEWADLIMVMEEKHKSRLIAQFRAAIRHKSIHVLDIPDDYGFMDPELVELLTSALEPIVSAAQVKHDSRI
ncbi:low molecular weight protein tyrosine phosphatase family protein [Pseudaestuariivita rosea]|uniref:low molecular weight protein tyrosine phosphatase family protein n=1 Tax=Pseudaestuariivita rosea TaxID=2763263 RepID=UPI001ABA4C2D|nr:phosphotyrosine protein phosphatase [Pseudaestuariivita rosea]